MKGSRQISRATGSSGRFNNACAAAQPSNGAMRQYHTTSDGAAHQVYLHAEVATNAVRQYIYFCVATGCQHFKRGNLVNSSPVSDPGSAYSAPAPAVCYHAAPYAEFGGHSCTHESHCEHPSLAQRQGST